MGVDPGPRAKYRRGELRMVLGLPEPWTEAQRADFIRTIEILAGHADVGPFAGLDVTTGDVEVQGMTLITWVPGVDQQPQQVLTPAGLDIMVLRYGLRESQARMEAVEAAKKESFNLGYAVGMEQGQREARQAMVEQMKRTFEIFSPPQPPVPDLPTTPSLNAVHNHSAQAYDMAHLKVPSFELGPLEEDEPEPPKRAWSETCVNCGEVMTQCNRNGCGGHKAPGFRWPLDEPCDDNDGSQHQSSEEG